jgi:hypothetical protein
MIVKIFCKAFTAVHKPTVLQELTAKAVFAKITSDPTLAVETMQNAPERAVVVATVSVPLTVEF